MNYAKQLPLDKNNMPYETLPAFTSQQSQNGVPTVSSVITLSPNTTVLDVTAFSGTAGSGAIIGKWGPSSVTGTNFDWCVNCGVSRTFVIPQSVFGAQLASVAGIGAQMGLYTTVAVKVATATSASIFTAEY